MQFYLATSRSSDADIAKIDRIRLNSIRASPIMSAIEDLLDKLDGPSTAKLIPRLTKAIRTSLSLPSKVGCSRVVVNLVMRHPVLFKPYADEVAKALLAAVKDRSEVVSRGYAVAIGYACRIAADKGILTIVDWAKKSYWEGEERERTASGAVLAAVYKQCVQFSLRMCMRADSPSRKARPTGQTNWLWISFRSFSAPKTIPTSPSVRSSAKHGRRIRAAPVL